MSGNQEATDGVQGAASSAQPNQAPSVVPAQAVDEEVLDATLSTGSTAPTLSAPSTERYDPEKSRDKTRTYIAYWLLSLLTVLLLCSFGLLLAIAGSTSKVTFEQLKSLVELLLGPLIALVSAATGFYFGSQTARTTPKS